MKNNQTVLIGTQYNPIRKLILTHDRTEAEVSYLLILVGLFEEMGLNAELHCRCLLANSKGEFRRPDFYLPKFGIVIEIDGITREAWDSRLIDTKDRDDFYADLCTLPVVRLNATDVVSHAKVNRFKDDLKKLILHSKLPSEKIKRINKKICDGRSKIIQLYGHKFDENGTSVPQFDKVSFQIYKHYKLKEFRHYGGTKISFRSSYETVKKLKYKLIKGHMRKWPMVNTVPLDNYIEILNDLQSASLGDGAKADLIDDFMNLAKISYPQFSELRDDYIKQFMEKS